MWKLTEQTMILVRINLVQCKVYTVQQHDVDDTIARNSYQGKAMPLNTPGALEAEDDS